MKRTDRKGPSRLVLSAAIAGSLAAAAGQARRPVSLVITNGTVVTIDRDQRVLSPGAVAIDGRDIVAVDTPVAVAARFTASATIDATHQIVMPGLVNTHGHAPMVLYRGLADDLSLMEWLDKYIFPAEARTVSPQMVRVGTRLAALEMIGSGTTTFTDMYYFEEEVAREAKAAGLRAVVGETIIGFPSPDAKTPDEALKRAEDLMRTFAGDDLITPAVAPHALYTLDARALKASRTLADRYRAPVIFHLAETEDEVTRSRDEFHLPPVAYLDSIGFWGPRTIAAHGVWVSDAEIPILRARGVAISHNPESNMKLASGTAPVPALLQAGLVVGLGTDGAASNNDLDMFEAMRQAALLHKLARRDPRAIPAATALEMATINGARALGLDKLIGSLEAGKRADVITVSMAGARQTPMYNAISHLVYVARGSDVTNSIVNGRVLMRDGKLLTLDEGTVLADARRLAEKVRATVK
jgi:5-methylthioadenosine/S-adenosylhomocysteine deaminase